jgi:putative alpha-1,2-mannosidase
VLIADAYVKNLPGIDYRLGLEAMLKDATVPPGSNEEQKGRGGLLAYNKLGYVPYGVDRAGNRTLDYAYDDYCISVVAKGLGQQALHE